MRRNPELAQRSRQFTKQVMSLVFDVRTVRGIKQSDLAHRVGINRGHLANMASGRNTMSAVTLFDLAEELQVPVAALIPRKPHRVVGDGLRSHSNNETLTIPLSDHGSHTTP